SSVKRTEPRRIAELRSVSLARTVLSPNEVGRQSTDSLTNEETCDERHRYHCAAKGSPRYADGPHIRRDEGHLRRADGAARRHVRALSENQEFPLAHVGAALP